MIKMINILAQYHRKILYMDVLDACQLRTMIKMTHSITQYYSENIFPDMDILDAWLPWSSQDRLFLLLRQVFPTIIFHTCTL